MSDNWISLIDGIDKIDEDLLDRIINNPLIGGASIITYEDGNVNILKASEGIKDVVCMNVPVTDLINTHTIGEFLDKDNVIFGTTIQRAVNTKREETCDTWRHVKSSCGEADVCVRSFIKAIAKDKDKNKYLLFVRDANITKDKLEYKDVAESEYKFRTAAEQINVYAWEYTVATHEMRPCYRCMRDLGLPALVENYPDTAIELGIFPPDYADMYRDWHRQLDNGAEFLEADIPLTIERVPFHVRYTAEFDENGKPYKAYGSATLIQEDKEKEEAIEGRKHAEEELAKALKIAEEEREKAEAASDAKTAFLFNMSHDIRTPMNAIIGFTNLLEEKIDDSEKRADYIEKIKESSTVLLSLINNVLEMARIEKGNIALEEKPVCLNDFFKSVCIVFRDLMQQKDLSFNQDIDIEHCCVLVDEIKLREILLNLLSNAYKYTRDGGSVDFIVREEISDIPNTAKYIMSVKDTGIGMSKDFIPHIFEEFSRELTSTETKIEGTGLGMPIVKRYLDLMDGNLTIDSKLNNGSTFTVTITLKLTDEIDKSACEEVARSTGMLNGKRILLAEDNDLNAEIAESILEQVGILTERAENGQQCVDMLIDSEDKYYDAILMDIQMPLMNGIEATKQIRLLSNAAKANIPIIAMTANAFEEDRKKSFDAGMNAHLAKPIVNAELFDTLLDLIDLE